MNTAIHAGLRGRCRPNLFTIPSLLLALLVLLLAGCGGEPLPTPATVPGESLAEARGDTPAQHALKLQDPWYVCPMHPQIVRDAPGTCPICGMTLVAKQLDEPLTEAAGAAANVAVAQVNTATAASPEVTVSPAMIQALGVRTAPVARETLRQSLRTVGRVAYDETRLAHVHPRAEGWIETLRVRSAGAPVRQGETLADLYAPRILNAQVEFLLALDQPREAARVKADKARNLLRLLDIPDNVIHDLERTRQPRNTVPVRAPLDGVMTGLMAREGMYVTEATEMFAIADLSRVWVLVDVYEDQLDWLASGLTAEIRVPAHPGRTWTGQVDYLYPELDPKTRTLPVRLVFPNPDLALRPNMFAEVVIRGAPQPDALVIPQEALIVTGTRAVVVKGLGGGRFQPAEVVAGRQQGGAVEILAGLTAGEEVVVSGQFLIDSEANLKASLMRLSEPGTSAEASAPSSPHHHH